MPELIRNRPFETTEPVITIDTSPPPGRYLIQLVVENARGVRSQPAQHLLTITRTILDRPRPGGPVVRPSPDVEAPLESDDTEIDKG